MIGEFVSVGIGGFLGSCLRFLFVKISNHLGYAFPFGTLVSNILAGLAIGFIIGVEKQTRPIPSQTKLFLTTGLLGGLSTFSTFSLETVNFFMEGKYLSVFGNITLNLGLSLIFVVVGMLLAKMLFANT